MEKTSKHEIESTREFRPANAPIQDAVVGEERSGHAHAKAAAPKATAGAVTPPHSGKPIPTASMAERLRERLKKGG
jgi:hypothetical protein